MKFKQEDIHCMCVMHLQDSGMREKNLHYLRRKAPSVRLLRELYSEEFKRSACHWPEGSCKLWAQFVCCKCENFLNREQPHYFQAQVFPAWKTGKRILMHRYTNTGTHTLHCFEVGCLNLSWHLIRLSFPWSFLWSKSDLNWLQRISGLSK